MVHRLRWPTPTESPRSVECVTGTVPPRLHVKLRANREGTTLPDNHGQIWAELATLSSNDGNLFKDSNKVVEQQMLEHLGLSSRVKFPVRRLATLWKNERWNQMITRWCRFPMGQSLFTISTFEWMASCRIDDYWFAAFDQVIQAASTLHGRFGLDIDVPDWNQLASLPATRSQTDVQGLFYPELAPDEVPQPSSDRPRNFLPALRDEAYHDLHRSVALDPAYRFFDIQALLKTTKQEGKIMSAVMSHVGQWLNRKPTRVADRNSNKPALRGDLIPGLQKKYGEEAEAKSIVLQQQLLDFVRCHAKDFTSAAIDHHLHEYPDAHTETYAARFELAVWQRLLSLVRDFVGPNLQHPCMARFNSGVPWSIPSQPLLTVAHIARDSICQSPEIAQNPALRSPSAADKLDKILQLAVTKWALELCTEALAYGGDGWGASETALVEAHRAKFATLLTGLDPAQSSPTYEQRTPASAAHGSRVSESCQVTPAFRADENNTKQATPPVSTPVVQPPLTGEASHDLRQNATRRQRRTSASAGPNVASLLEDSQSSAGDGQGRVHTIKGSRHWRRKGTASQAKVA
ncbi:hypothetical protein PSPO01_15842 [Paraphaeosphaeria sporulosa]